MLVSYNTLEEVFWSHWNAKKQHWRRHFCNNFNELILILINYPVDNELYMIHTCGVVKHGILYLYSMVSFQYRSIFIIVTHILLWIFIDNFFNPLYYSYIIIAANRTTLEKLCFKCTLGLKQSSHFMPCSNTLILHQYSSHSQNCSVSELFNLYHVFNVVFWRRDHWE